MPQKEKKEGAAHAILRRFAATEKETKRSRRGEEKEGKKAKSPRSREAPSMRKKLFPVSPPSEREKGNLSDYGREDRALAAANKREHRQGKRRCPPARHRKRRRSRPLKEET